MKIKYKYFDTFFWGFSLGLLLPIITIVVFYYSNIHRLSLQEFFITIFKIKLLSQVISLGAFPNLMIFFLFLWKDCMIAAKGVLAATVLMGILTVLTKFVI